MSPEPADPSRDAHPRALEPWLLGVTLVLAVAGAVIGMQIITTLGVTPNTSIVGVMIAIILSRVPLRPFRSFRSVHRQNLVQTAVSSATFGAANSLMVPVGIPILLGRPDLAIPMLAGATMGMLIDLAMLYWLFDTDLFPAAGPWPIGIASAEAIEAGDEGGRRARLLGLGGAAGALGSSGGFGALHATVGVAALPMAAFGLAFLGNVWALAMFGTGLLVRGYAPELTGWEPATTLTPHGMMIGAGLVALGQAVFSALRRERARSFDATRTPNRDGARSDREARAGLLRGTALYVVAGAGLAVAAGAHTGMGPAAMAGWVVFAAIACVAAEFIVGLSAMQAGWFPAFATALVFLLVGIALGFPPAATGLLVGFVASGGPAFADAGYDFKTGWLLRGRGSDPALEREGRRQQLVAALVGLGTALALVALFHGAYFGADRFPPVVRVYVAAIDSGIDPDTAGRLALWALPGAALQLLGGPRRQLGILFATGLLIDNPLAGWAVLLGLGLRRFLSRDRGVEDSPATVFAGGVIAGDALWAFGSSLLG